MFLMFEQHEHEVGYRWMAPIRSPRWGAELIHYRIGEEMSRRALESNFFRLVERNTSPLLEKGGYRGVLP